MQREVRRFTRELAEKRGRPFHLAVRVCPSIEGSMRTGYDVPVWIVRPRPPLESLPEFFDSEGTWLFAATAGGRAG